MTNFELKVWARRVVRGDGSTVDLSGGPVTISFSHDKFTATPDLGGKFVLIGINAVQFLNPDLNLFPGGDLPPPELAGETLLDLPEDGDAGRRAGHRLYRFCALNCSLLHFTSDRIGFNFQLVDGKLLDDPRQGDGLAAEDILTSARTGISTPSSILDDAFSKIDAIAELGTRIQLRHPYLAGAIVAGASGSGPTLESFAHNADAPAIIGAVLGTKPDIQPASRSRWGEIAELHDGFWWSRSAGPDHLHMELSLSDALKRLGSVPAEPGSPVQKRVLSRREPKDIARAAQLEVLDLLGLKAMPSKPVEIGAETIHCLDAEWNYQRITLTRWLFVADGHDSAPGRAVKLVVETPTIASDGKFASARMILSELTDAQFCAIWEKCVAKPIRDTALADATGGGISLLPRFSGTPGISQWEVTIDLDDPNSADSRETRGRLARYPVKAITLKRKAPTVGASGISLPGLQTHAGSDAGLTVSGAFEFNLADPIILKVDASGRLRLDSETKTTVKKSTSGVSAASQIVTLSGIDLTMGDGEFCEFSDVGFQVSWPGAKSTSGYAAIGLSLPLASVAVGGSDHEDPAPDRRPMIWGGSVMTGGTIALDDQVNSTGERIVAANLHPPVADPPVSGVRVAAPEFSVIAIDPAPMFVSKASLPSLAAPTQVRDSMATWQSQEGLWKIIPPDDSPQVLGLTLPPQGVAEAWERTANYLPTDQIIEGGRVPARLTPNTELQLEADERARNAIAPWNLRELLGFTDADLPGARLIEIKRSEVLYGLEANAGPIKGMRLAEMAAWRGVPAEPRARIGDTREMWKAGIAAFARRLAVLDLRDESDLSVRPKIANARFKLRTKKDGGKYILPYKQDPPSDWGPTPWTPAAKGGILGGTMAGFEQKSLVDKLPGRTDGVGEIDGFQLSALGAWTTPRAQFQNGLTRISAEAAMGRIAEARFERIGRIGMLHHVAKHVIVYRRTFLPSRQFVGDQDHPKNEGRPIVRKVEEYIELMQPQRNYPDRALATAKDNGPVLGARFRTIRIPVSGGWASPIEDSRVAGYWLPLWRERADQGIYPKPVVELQFAGDPARSEPEPIARRIANPDCLRFYTLTEVGAHEPSGDVEIWPLVYGLDLVDRLTDSPLNTDRPIDKDQFEDTSPDASAAPGLEDYTLILEPGPPINVAQARSDKPTMADLRTVLMLRARQPEKASVDGSKLGEVQKAQGALVKLAGFSTDTAQTLDQAKVEAVERLSQVAEAAKNIDIAKMTANACSWAHAPDRAITKLTEMLGTGNNDLQARLRTYWKTNKDRTAAEINAATRAIEGLLPLDAQMATLFKPVLEQAKLAEATVKDELEAVWAQADAAITEAKAAATGGLNALAANLEKLKEYAEAQGDNAVSVLSKIEAEVEPLARKAASALDLVCANLQKIDGLVQSLRKSAAKLTKSAPKAASALNGIIETISSARSRLEVQARKLAADTPRKVAEARRLIGVWRVRGAAAKQEAIAAISAAEGAVSAAKAEVSDLCEKLSQAGKTGMGSALTAISLAIDDANKWVNDVADMPLGAIEQDLRALVLILKSLREVIDAAEPPNEPFQELAVVHSRLVGELTALADKFKEQAKILCEAIKASGAGEMATKLLEDWSSGLGEIKQAILDAGDLVVLADQVAKNATALGQALGQVRQGIEQMLDGKIAKRILEGEVVPNGLGEAVGLKLLRAAGAPPIVEQLVFNREQIAYHFENETNRVIVTPVKAFVDQAEQALRGVGLELPTLGIGDTLLSPLHDEFNDLRKSGEVLLKDLKFQAQDVLKDFAGLKQLLPNLSFDSKLARAIKVTHDYDAKRAIAWLQAAIDYGPETQDLFRHSAFAVVAENMRITGLSRYERGLNGGEGRKVHAELISDWVLIIGGLALVRIRDAAIRYDGSGLKFDIRPEKIEFPGALKLLTDALATINAGDNPLSIQILNDPRSGMPIGLSSSYDLPPTSFGVGVVSVMNAALGVRMELAQRAEFEIVAAAYFGRKASPFAITVSFLGGAGYVEARAIHVPALRRTDLALSISIGLAAGTGFSFGPLKGSIQVYLGFEATFYSSSAGSRTAISVLFVLSGSVTAWGFVTVNLSVRLALTYDGKKMLGHGDIDIEVRISRFYKKSFSRAITYKLT